MKVRCQAPGSRPGPDSCSLGYLRSCQDQLAQSCPEAAGTFHPQVHFWVISRCDLRSGRMCCPGCGNLVTVDH